MIESIRSTTPEVSRTARRVLPNQAMPSAYQNDVLIRSLVQECRDQNWKSVSQMFDSLMERHHQLMQDLKRYLQKIIPLQLAEKAERERLNRR